MMPPRRSCCVALLFASLLPALSRAADILQEVPNDAVGIVVVRNLGTIDARARSLSLELRGTAFSPLAFLKTVTTIQEGLNLKGDLLLVAYPDARADRSKLRYCVWFPVSDYARFMKMLGATSKNTIATATVAGEDLLIAHRGEWALVMDPDQRDRMTQTLSAPPSPPPQLAAWKKWIDASDATLIAFAPGIHELRSWAEKFGDGEKTGNDTSDDLFGDQNTSTPRNSLAAVSANRSPGDIAANLSDEFRKWTAASPAIARAVEQANAFGFGIRLDASGNGSNDVVAGLRVSLDDGPAHDPKDAKDSFPFSLHDTGGFAIHGAGRLPAPVLATLASASLQRIAADFKREEHTELDEDSLKQLNDAVEQAAADIRSASLLMQPGAQSQPPYSNNFVALRVSSAKNFVAHSAEVMRLWNKANRDADGETKLVFLVEEVALGSRSATQYSLDSTAMLGAAPELPEIRQAMEKLFGAGGKLRLWTVPIDDATVLLAVGSPEQVTAALKMLDRKQPIDWNRNETRDTNRLLPANSDWRMFFDPHRYCEWLARESMATMSVPVIGGPLVRPFPDCPPIGVAGGFRDRELWIECAALAPAIKNAYLYVTYSPKKRRPEVQRPLQPAPR